MGRRHPKGKYAPLRGPNCDCGECSHAYRQTGTFNSTAFRDKSQRSDPSVTNTYFNAGTQDGESHGHVKYRNNSDGTTSYLYARDVEGNEYEV